jgi:Ca2+/Na+ antiporter
MKIWKLVSGILSIILFALVTMQSCAVGVANALEENGELSGSAGLFVAVLMLAGGIVSIVTRNSEKKGGNIALIVLFGLAALMGFAGAGSYSDLTVWAAWCLLCAAIAVIALVTGRKKTVKEEAPADTAGEG